MKLANKRVLITGAASGIGKASALAFAREGARVLCADLEEKVEETAAAITHAGGEAQAVRADVADEHEVEALVARAVDAWRGLDVIYANAGIVRTLAPLTELSAEDWEAVFRVNVMGVVHAFKHGARHLLAEKRPGALLATASVAGLRAGAGPAPYSASKAAVINLVQNTAVQLAGSGIRVNAICPGLIETGMTQPIFDAARAADKEHKIGQLNPLRRAGRPEEIAEVALLLASDAASYVNGTAVVVDGGLAASLPFAPGRMW